MVPMKNGGWWHQLEKWQTAINRDCEPIRKATPVQAIDADAIFKSFKNDQKRLVETSSKLGLTPLSLYLLGCRWSSSHGCWAFPMRNETGKIVGIRLRYDDGRKLAVKGSKVGLLYSEEPMDKTAYILEGPTDTAAAIGLGFSAIGRPSCLGCEEMVSQLLRIQKVTRAVIVADNDAPGIQGAEKLQKALKIPTCLWIPPAKDMRQFVQMGGTAQVALSMIRDLCWHQPK